MKILYVSAEVAPFAKVGGLADVAGSLPKALHALGHDVRVLMPSYRMVEEELGSRSSERETPHFEPSLKRLADFDVQINPSWVKKSYLNETSMDGVPLYMVGTDEWFCNAVSSETIYQAGGDAYMFLAAAAMEIPSILNWQPDIVHTNDWHTGFIPVLLREKMRWAWDPVPAVFTIHNLAYQGEFGADVLDKLNLPHYLFNMDQLEFFGSINFLKAGCVFSDQVNTVSPTYAHEIQTPEYGCHMEGLMMHLARQKRLTGILNGIDDRVFDPSLDPMIPAHYNAENLEGKSECRAALLSRLSLQPIEGAPLLGVVTRLSDQKGMNLLLHAAPQIFEMPCQLIVQGLGDPWLATSFEKLQKDYPKHFRFVSAFDVEMAQQIYAGCDSFLMPSLFEPCGLGQLIAMRYGTVPIVRSTGGLADTVHEGTNGFTFSSKTSDGLLDAVKRAHATFGVPSAWSELQLSGMRGDYTWEKSAREYVAMYERAIVARKAYAKSA